MKVWRFHFPGSPVRGPSALTRLLYPQSHPPTTLGNPTPDHKYRSYGRAGFVVLFIRAHRRIFPLKALRALVALRASKTPPCPLLGHVFLLPHPLHPCVITCSNGPAPTATPPSLLLQNCFFKTEPPHNPKTVSPGPASPGESHASH